MTIRTPLIFDSLATFDAYLHGMEREYEAQTDGEVAQSAGYERNIRVGACLHLLRDLRAVLRESMTAEQAEREQVAAEDSVEARWKHLDPVADALEIRRLAGDR